MGRGISGLLWLGALLGVAVGTFFFIDSILSAQSAPQQGALAAMGATAAILPYIAARAFDALREAWAPPRRVGDDKVTHPAK